MANKFYLIYDENMFQKYLFEDLRNEKNVEIFTSCINYKGIVGTVEKVCTSIKLNNFIKMPFSHFFYTIKKIDFKNANEEKYLIFTTEALLRISTDYINNLKSKYSNIKLILIILDSFHASSPTFIMAKKKINKIKFDLILTYDKDDASEFGFDFLGYSYYSAYKLNENSDILTSLYFAGGVKGGREDLIEKIAKKLSTNIKFEFDVFNSNKRNTDIPGIYYKNSWMPYEEILSKVERTNCILEILQNGQKTQSIRYFEAICYNKKLLTNNNRVSELPYYDSRYIKVFKDYQDIDMEWLKKEEQINYGYKDDFSPKNLLKKIQEKLN